MKRAIKNHLGDFAAILVLLVLSVFVAGYILSHERLRFPFIQSSPFEMKAEFSTAQAVTPGQGQTVRVSGVQVGEIGSVSLKNGIAIVTMEIDQKYKHLIHNDAYALLRVGFGPLDADYEWAKEAPPELVERVAPAEQHTYETIDAWMHLSAPEVRNEGADLPLDREQAYSKMIRPFTARRLSFSMPWVACRYPTQAQAEDAGMTLDEFTEFVYGACLLDWDAEAARMTRYKERFDAAREVRIVGAGTDLTLGLEGREGMVDDGHYNMPGGEFFFSPVEDARRGVIEFSEFPAVDSGHECEGVRLVFESGRVVEASARTDEAHLFSQLDVLTAEVLSDSQPSMMLRTRRRRLRRTTAFL